MLQRSLHTVSIIFFPESSAFGIGCGKTISSNHCRLRSTLCKKKPIFSSSIILFWDGSFFCPERRTFTIDMWSSLFVSLKVWRTQTPSLLDFSFFFKRQQIVNWDFLRSRFNLGVPLPGCILPFFLNYLDRNLVSVPLFVHLSMTYCYWDTLKSSFQWLVSKDTLVINAKNFLSWFY